MSDTPSLGAEAAEYVLAFADDEHLIGARHTAWIGLGPFLEEDLAFCSIAQDELGHAIGLYEVLLRAAGRDAVGDLDEFALLRDTSDYRSSHLAEVECVDWADSLVRHWLYDRAEAHRWSALEASSIPALSALAARAQREERFHLDHAERFMARVATTPQVAEAVARLLPLAVGAWGAVPGEEAALADGVTTSSSAELADRWRADIAADAAQWGLSLSWPDTEHAVATHGDRRRRSDAFAAFHEGLTRVLVLDPAATW